MTKSFDWISEVATEIPIKSLPEELQLLAELFGIEGVFRLCERFGGMNIYIPKKVTLIRNQRDLKIRNEFTGQNYRYLCNKYSLTETWIRQIVNYKEPKQRRLIK